VPAGTPTVLVFQCAIFIEMRCFGFLLWAVALFLFWAQLRSEWERYYFWQELSEQVKGVIFLILARLMHLNY